MDIISSSPVGLAEIDARLGCAQGTARQWVRRHSPGSRVPFPPVRWTVSGRDAYDWAEVRAWLQDTGRLVRTTRRHPETGVWEIVETAEPDTPPELGDQIRAALAGVPRHLWWTDCEDGRWYLRMDHVAPGGDLRTAQWMSQLLTDAGLLSHPEPGPAAAVTLARGQRIEVS